MNLLVAAAFAAACTLAPSVHSALSSADWCYHLPTCNDATWPTIATEYCNGSRQSPIDIVSSAARGDAELGPFSFEQFDNKSALQNIKNTGRTVKVTLASGVKISGGGLFDTYDTLQFHLHWGNGSSVPGSEHTVDAKRYPMELHIVNSKSTYNGNTTQAVLDSTGLAALGFFIEEMSGNASGQPASWKILSSYLNTVTKKDDSFPLAAGISLDDLLVGVDRTKYYRYLGSLTTPNCNEAVVWTVFKEPIKVSKDLIDLFSTTVHIADASSPFMVNVYRNVQPLRAVTTQAVSAAGAQAAPAVTCFTLVLVALALALGRD